MSRSFNKVETIPVRCYKTLQNLDRLWKPKVFPRTLQVKWTTSKMVFEITGLQFYSITYSRKDKYQGRYTIKKESSQH